MSSNNGRPIQNSLEILQFLNCSYFAKIMTRKLATWPSCIHFCSQKSGIYYLRGILCWHAFAWKPRIMCTSIYFSCHHGGTENGNASGWTEQRSADGNVASAVSWFWHHVWCYDHHTLHERWRGRRLHENHCNVFWVGTRLQWAGNAGHESAICFHTKVSVPVPSVSISLHSWKLCWLLCLYLHLAARFF